MNLTELLIRFLLFSFLVFNIAFVLGLITTEEKLKVVGKITLKNLVFIYGTVFILAILALLLVVIF